MIPFYIHPPYCFFFGGGKEGLVSKQMEKKMTSLPINSKRFFPLKIGKVGWVKKKGQQDVWVPLLILHLSPHVPSLMIVPLSRLLLFFKEYKQILKQ